MQKSKKVSNTVYGKPHVRIGKRGLTESVLSEISRNLKSYGIIKVRVMKSLIQYHGVVIKSLADEVARSVNAKVVDVRGNTFTLIKMRKEQD